MTLLSTFTQSELDPLALDPSGPRVVTIGGGHGLAACLQAVQGYASDITAVVTVADDGGSSGRLTSGLGIPPPGDIRRCLLALTPEPSIWYELFSYRFKGGADDPADTQARDVRGHSLGNLILAALTDLTGDFARGVARAADLLGAVGRVVPAATDALDLTAIIGGERVEGQVAVARTRGGIEKLILGPPGVHAHPDAVEAIRRADQVVIGPGSLFTSVLAALCVPGIAEAINRSPASVVFVLNLVTQDAETLGLSGSDHVSALSVHGGITRRGAVVVNVGSLEVPSGLEQVVLEGECDWRIQRDDVVDRDADWPAHDPMKLGRTLSALA